MINLDKAQALDIIAKANTILSVAITLRNLYIYATERQLYDHLWSFIDNTAVYTIIYTRTDIPHIPSWAITSKPLDSFTIAFNALECVWVPHN